MSDFKIPHLAPVKFVKSLLESDTKTALVKIGFDEIPTMGMLVEAATQSSSGILSDDTSKMGFLMTLKNVKLLKDIKSKEFTVHVKLDHKLENFKFFSFSINDDDIVSTGVFSVALQ